MPTKKKPTTIAKKPAAKKAAPAKKKAAPAKKAAKATAKKKAAPAKKAAKATAKKTTAKKVAKVAKKTTAKKVATKAKAKKTTAKKVAKKAAKKAAKKTTAKKVAKVAKKTTAKKVAKVAKKVAAKKVAKKATATKATATKKATAPRIDLAKGVLKTPSHGAVALPGRKNGVPKSYEAASTLIPNDDALEGAMGDAFDAVFASPYGAQKPKKPKSTEPFVPGDPTADLAQICAALALDKKADDVVILEVADLTSYADYFVIAGASSERLAQAVARTISDELRKRGRQPLSTDGMEQGNWVILDYGAVVVHVFMATARAYYDLDGFWSDAPRVDVDEGRGIAALEHMDKIA